MSAQGLSRVNAFSWVSRFYSPQRLVHGVMRSSMYWPMYACSRAVSCQIGAFR